MHNTSLLLICAENLNTGFYKIKKRPLNFASLFSRHQSFFSRNFDFAIFFKSRKSRKLSLAKISVNKKIF